jgi:hypothetical protein
MQYLSLIRQLYGPGVSISVHAPVAEGEGSCLILRRGNNMEDSRYVLVAQQIPGIDHPFKAVFGPSGLLESAYMIEGRHDSMLFSRQNAYGHFEAAQSVDLPRLTDSLYAHIRTMGFQSNNIEKFDWNYHKMMARFSAFSSLIHGKIVPDFSDTMIAINVLYGCPYSCNECPESGKFITYSADEIKHSIDTAVSLARHYHGSTFAFDEAFVSASDIIWFLRKGLGDPIEIAQMLAGAFSYHEGSFSRTTLSKRSTFIGTPNILWLKHEDPAYATELFRWYNRAYLGVETFDDSLSDAHGKHFTLEEKLEAIEFVLNTPIQKLKLIFQIGLSGEDTESVSTTSTIAAKIAKKYNHGNTPRVTFEISEHMIRGKKNGDTQQKRDIWRESFKGVDLVALRFDYEYALPHFQPGIII